MTTAAAEKPTQVRYGVLGYVCALSMITYLDRVCFSSAVGSIVHDLDLNSAADLKWAFTAFAFAYAAFEVPSGWLGDVFGPKNVLIRIVLWWSLFTVLTGCIWKFTLDSGQVLTVPLTGWEIPLLFSGLTLLGIIRFLFGMGEAGAYPNITRALHNWFPLRERAIAQGAVWMAGRFMGGITHLIWAALVVLGGLSWRIAFFSFGALGIFWCVAFARWFRNRPEEKPEVNAAEIALIHQGKLGREEAGHAGVPWKRIFTSGNVWVLCLMYFCAAYGWYFNITYLPNYLEEQHAVGKDSLLGAIYKGGPLLFGAMTCLLGGWLSDRFIRRTGNLKWGRRLFGIIGHGLCAFCYLGCIYAPSAFLFFLAISLAGVFNDLIMGPAWACCQDIGKRYAAIVAGFMNTIGNLGGAVAGWVTGMILEHHLAAYAAGLGRPVAELTTSEKASGLLPGYEVNFLVFGAVYLVAVLFWLRIDPTKSIDPQAH